MSKRLMALGVACILLVFVFVVAIAIGISASQKQQNNLQVIRTVEEGGGEAIHQPSDLIDIGDSNAEIFESLCSTGVSFVSVDSDTDELDIGLRGSTFMVLPMDGCLVPPLFCVYTQSAGSTNGGVSCGNLLNP